MSVQRALPDVMHRVAVGLPAKPKYSCAEEFKPSITGHGLCRHRFVKVHHPHADRDTCSFSHEARVWQLSRILGLRS